MSLNKVIAIVGMCGSGKSIVSEELKKLGWGYVRFGQLTLDEVKKRGLPPKEEHERKIREEFRKEHGMAAYAILNIPKIDDFLAHNNVIADGLYSWSEYKILKEKYADNLLVISVYADPKTRYTRLENRASAHGNDEDLVFRSISNEDAQNRDYAEIEKIEKAGPIAMADYTLINTKNEDFLLNQLKEVMHDIQA
ncbi:MAG: AAA family ATPase [Pseudomonadota bacterium]